MTPVLVGVLTFVLLVAAASARARGDAAVAEVLAATVGALDATVP